MKKQSLFLFLVFFLAACAPSTPMPTETPIPTATSTLTPVPTSTPTATATPEPWVALAEEYDMPEEIARQLSEMDVSFEENPSSYVEGILVVNNETGEDLFYYDAETGVWVSANRWQHITNAELLRENPISGEEILSDEFFAWLKYLLSQTDSGVGPNVNLVPEITERGEMIELGTSKGNSYLINYPGLLNHGITYADLTASPNNEERRYQVVVNGYEYKGRKYPLILLSRYAPEYISAEVMTEAHQEFDSMQRSPVMKDSQDIWGENDPFVEKSFLVLGKDGVKEAMDAFQHGNPSLVGKPGAVYLTFVSHGELFDN